MTGSQTAKNGFANESDVVNKFNNWETDVDASNWLQAMGYDLSNVERVIASKLAGYKTDVQVQITTKSKNVIESQNLQVKLVSQKSGFNQIDKRWVDTYTKMWNIPENVSNTLKQYTGEIVLERNDVRDARRVYLNEHRYDAVSELIEWVETNRFLIISDIMKGRGQFSAEWILVVQKRYFYTRSVLVPMNVAMSHYVSGPVKVTPTGNIKIGNVNIQRKGGDGGRKTSTMLQFKIDPVRLFEI